MPDNIGQCPACPIRSPSMSLQSVSPVEAGSSGGALKQPILQSFSRSMFVVRYSNEPYTNPLIFNRILSSHSYIDRSKQELNVMEIERSEVTLECHYRYFLN